MDLVSAIQSRIAEPKKTTDDNTSSRVRPPLPPVVIDALEQQSGVVLPADLRELYTHVGDGGFGPGYGFKPLSKVIGSVEGFAAYKAPLLPSTKAPVLAMVVEWGCGIASLVDCADENARVLRFDPNVEEGEYPGTGLVPLAPSLYPEADSLSGWLGRWLNGEKLFYTGFGFIQD